MSRYGLLAGFRTTEVLFCCLLITAFTAITFKSLRAYLINAKVLEPHSQLQGMKLSIAIDNAYTGDFSNTKNVEYAPQNSVSKLSVSPEGHMTAQFSFSDSAPYSETDLSQKTLVLLLNSNNQQGYQFNSWQCPDNPNLAPFSIKKPIDNGTIDPRYSHFICHGTFR